MRERRGVDAVRLLCSGPGRLCQALGVTHAHNGLRLDRRPFRVVAGGDAGARRSRRRRASASRKAVELPWRFVLAGSPFLSKPMRGDAGDRRSGASAAASRPRAADLA